MRRRSRAMFSCEAVGVVDEVSAGMALVSSTAVFNRIGGWRQGSKRNLAALGNGC